VNHDVAAELVTSVLPGAGAVVGVGIIYAEGKVVATVRVEGFNFVNALGDLPVALAELGTCDSAGGFDGVNVDEFHRPIGVASPDFEKFFLFETDECEARWRIGDTSLRIERREARADGVAVLKDSLLNGAGLGNARLDKSRRGVNARPLPDCKDAKNEDDWKRNAKKIGAFGHE